MNREEIPNNPISGTPAAGNVPQRRENEESGLPTDLHSTDSLISSDASQQHVEVAIPPSEHQSSIQHAARASPILEGEVLRPITKPGNDSMLEDEETSDHETLPYARQLEPVSRAQERKATSERYSRPYVESVDSADDDVPREKQARGEMRSRQSDGPMSEEDKHPLGNDATTQRVDSHQASVEGDLRGSMSFDSKEEVELGENKKAKIHRRGKSVRFAADQFETAVGQEETDERETDSVPVRRRGPTYPKIHKKYISLETLRYYDLPWVYDRYDPDYIIITREIDEYETQVLFDHTRRLRTSYWKDKNTATREEPESAFYRKRDRKSNRSRKIRIFGLDGEHLGLDHSEDPLSTAPDVRGFEAGGPRDREVEEATRRLDKDPDFNMQKCTEPCLSAVEQSSYVPCGPSKAFLLTLTERIVSADEEIGLFRRRHLQLPELDFNKFRCGILELYEPRGFERLQILLHMEEIQKAFEKRYAADINSRRIEPYCLKTGSGQFDILSCCVPFFHVRQYGKLNESTPSTQRSQTLLQMRYSGAHKQQDLRQVICQKQGGNQCLHVSYLWAIIINNDTLVTASILSELELFRVSSLQIESGLPASLQPETVPPSKTQYIHIQGPGDAIWLLERAECRTWFEFALHFEKSTLALQDGAIVEYEGTTVLPSQWPLILEKTRDTTMKLRLYKPDDASEETSSKKFEHILEIDLSLSRPIGSAISASFDPSAKGNRYKSKRDPALQTEQQDENRHQLNNGPDVVTHDEMEDYLEGLQLDRELALYRACPSMSFGELLVVLRQNEPISQHDQNEQGSAAQDEAERVSSKPYFTDSDRTNADGMGSVALESRIEGYNSDQARRGDMGSHITSDESTSISHCSETTTTLADLSIPSKADESSHIPDIVATVSSTGTEGLASGHARSVNPSDDKDSDRQQRSTPPQEARSDIDNDDFDGKGIQHREGGSSRPTLIQEIKNLAEGVRALLYIFAEDREQRQLDKCRGKLCGALNIFVGRLDAGISSPVDHEAQKLFQVRAISFLHEMYGLLDLARALQYDQFGTEMLRTAFAISLPDSFTVAMRSATLAIIFANSMDTEAGEGSRISHWAVDAENSLMDSVRGVFRSLRKPSLKSRSAARPKEVLANLARGVTGRVLPDNLFDGSDLQRIYDDYIKKLEYEVRAEMPGRRTVKHLRNLRYELDAMNEQLKIQMIELASLNNRLLLSDSQLNGLEEENKDRSRPDIRPQVLVASCLQDDESGTQFTSATLTRAVEEAAQRRAEFQKFKWRTQDWLEEASDKADWRNTALVIFIITTIIFLPLSFVASVFGMKTVDLWNMSHGQWPYWVSVLPITALVANTVWQSDLLPFQRWIN